LLSSVWANAQTNDSIVSDTTALTISAKKALMLKKKFGTNDSVQQARFDTIDLRKPKPKEKEKKIFIPDPNKSMWYALIFPGLGQIYNRRYWKLPIVYSGFVGLAYGIGWFGKNYSFYKRVYILADKGDNSWKNMVSDFEKNLSSDKFKTKMDNARRYRDLCIIGIVAFYGITVIDAFVDAALSDFDISPDLSMKIVPKVIQNQENTALAMQLNLRF